jgi:hypothetical protein
MRTVPHFPERTAVFGKCSSAGCPGEGKHACCEGGRGSNPRPKDHESADGRAAHCQPMPTSRHVSGGGACFVIERASDSLRLGGSLATPCHLARDAERRSYEFDGVKRLLDDTDSTMKEPWRLGRPSLPRRGDLWGARSRLDRRHLHRMLKEPGLNNLGWNIRAHVGLRTSAASFRLVGRACRTRSAA